METLVQIIPPNFGPPINTVTTEPVDRPLALALVLDISHSLHGTRKVSDLFKANLVQRFSTMEHDNVLILNGECHEDPGSAVAAIHKHNTVVRNLSVAIMDSMNVLMKFDRMYRRRLLILTDQFMLREANFLKKAVSQNTVRLLDISFFIGGYGPQYSRVVADCGWEYCHIDDPSEVATILTEVCK